MEDKHKTTKTTTKIPEKYFTEYNQNEYIYLWFSKGYLIKKTETFFTFSL